jgi:hypothetical protein
MKIDDKLWSHCQALTSGYKPPRRVLPGSPIPRTHLGQIGRVKVYLVDGNAVKLRYKMDFVEGNNSMESSWIPKDELWISDELVPKYWAPVLYHEAHEWRDMRRGMSYDQAHRIANRHEKVLRKGMEDENNEDAAKICNAPDGKIVRVVNPENRTFIGHHFSDDEVKPDVVA